MMAAGSKGDDTIPQQSVLSTRDVFKEYKLGHGVVVQALRGVNLDILEGEFVSIMGPSGSGKTTLLNIIGALDRPSKGSVYIGRQDISKLSDRSLTKFRRHECGYVFQHYNLIQVLSALQNVELPMIIAGMKKSDRRKRAEELLGIVGLTDRLHHKPDQLSGGERQRVTIARALANTPHILLCDEPTGDLDSETGREIMELLKQVNREHGQTLVVITHDGQVGREAQRLITMKDGQVADIVDL